ncbi:hypothetical protein ACOMHN_031990 [Nucella lapillus]
MTLGPEERATSSPSHRRHEVQVRASQPHHIPRATSSPSHRWNEVQVRASQPHHIPRATSSPSHRWHEVQVRASEPHHIPRATSSITMAPWGPRVTDVVPLSLKESLQVYCTSPLPFKQADNT